MVAISNVDSFFTHYSAETTAGANNVATDNNSGNNLATMLSGYTESTDETPVTMEICAGKLKKKPGKNSTGSAQEGNPPRVVVRPRTKQNPSKPKESITTLRDQDGRIIYKGPSSGWGQTQVRNPNTGEYDSGFAWGYSF